MNSYFYFFFQKIRKSLVDGRVIEGHIIPHRLLFTSMAPTPEFPTVAWIENGIQVKADMHNTYLDRTHSQSHILQSIPGGILCCRNPEYFITMKHPRSRCVY